MENGPYVSAVGSVMYPMVCTRPNLAYAISTLSRFMSRPGKEHWRDEVAIEVYKWETQSLSGKEVK